MISDRHQDLYRAYYNARQPALEPPPPLLWHDAIWDFAVELGARKVLDYGSGPACQLAAHMPKHYQVWSYDPGVYGLDTLPSPVDSTDGWRPDLVVCSHMLEHCEITAWRDTLTEILAMARRGVFLAVSCERSTKTLPDGSDWHSTVYPQAVWRDVVAAFAYWQGYAVQELTPKRKEYVALLTRTAQAL